MRQKRKRSEGKSHKVGVQTGRKESGRGRGRGSRGENGKGDGKGGIDEEEGVWRREIEGQRRIKKEREEEGKSRREKGKEEE